MTLTARQLALPGRLCPTDLDLAGPAMVALIGANGSGKTSLLRALAQVEDMRGEVTIDGERLAGPRRERLVAMMSAARGQRWPIPVRDLIRLGNERVGTARIDELIDALELGALADRRADSLSTGEQARVALARVLAPDARLLLLDEPLANLDPYWGRRFQLLLRAHATGDRIIISALHNLSLLGDFDRVLLVDKGRVAASGSALEVSLAPAFEAAFRMSAAEAGVSLSADRRSSP